MSAALRVTTRHILTAAATNWYSLCAGMRVQKRGIDGDYPCFWSYLPPITFDYPFTTYALIDSVTRSRKTETSYNVYPRDAARAGIHYLLRTLPEPDAAGGDGVGWTSLDA